MFNRIAEVPYCDVRRRNRKIFIYIIIKNCYHTYSSRAAVIDKVQNLKYAFPHNILSIFDKRSRQVMRVRTHIGIKKRCVNRYY